MNENNIILDPASNEAMSIEYKNAVGYNIGNFTILELVGNSKVRALCKLCNNENYITHFHKIKSGHSKSCGCKQKLVNPEQYIGNKYNKLTVLDICSQKDLDGAILAKFRCDCGNVVTKRLNMVIRDKIRSCGCIKNIHKSNVDFAIPDKDKYNKIMSVWRQMLKRCHQSGDDDLIKKEVDEKHWKYFLGKPAHARYHDYGAKGIKVCKEWFDFNTFYKWHIKNVEDGKTVDRINPNEGYNPENCRGASASLQNVNQGLRKDNMSGYRGICYTGHSYRLELKYNGSYFKKEGFKTPEIAIIERNILVCKYKFPNPIQPLLNKVKVGIFKSAKDFKFHIGYYYSQLDALMLSPTTFETRDDPLAIEVCEKMNQNL